MLTTEEKAFLDALYQRYARIVFMYSYSLLQPLPDAWATAEECTQDTFEKAMTKIGILLRHESPEGWLITTCRNITLTRKRKKWNRTRIIGVTVPIDESHPVADPHDFVEEWILKNDLVKAKEELLGSLSKQEMAVFRACYEEGQSVRSTAEALRLSESAVRGTIQRIRQKAKQISPLLFMLLYCMLRF